MAEINGIIMLQVKQKKRIEYIDCFRGLCIFWVVWYHSSHPEWVEYPFRMPALFFVSGIFFKQYEWSIFWRKKVNQYVIPFFFFYILYYFFLVAINFLKDHTVSYEIWNSITNVFTCYAGSAGYIVNYPLWFMIALLVMQLVTYTIRLVSNSNFLLLSLSAMLTILAHYWLWYIELPLFLGKALSYYIYYAVGVVFGRKYINAMEEGNVKLSYEITALLIIVLLVIFSCSVANSFIKDICDYTQFLIIPFVLLYVFRNYITNKLLSSILLFMGSNSLVIFGLHDMFLSIQRIIISKFCDVDNNVIGLMLVFVTIVAVYPSILLFEKYIPVLIGKKPLLTIK